MSLASGTSWTSAAFALGLDVAAKATVILLLGLIVQLAAGRRRAAPASAVGNACLLGLLLLPPTAAFAPRLSVAYLPPAPEPSRLGPRPAPPADPGPARFDGPTTTAPIVGPIGEPSPIDAPRAARPTLAAVDRPVPPRPAAIPAPALEATPAPSPSRPADWPAIAMVGYATVAAVLLARLLASLAAVERLRRAGVPVDDPNWLDALERCRRRLGIRRPVALSWSPRLGIPIVLGWIRPTIMLPASLSDLDPRDHAEPILLHELSHVRRGDYPWNVVLRLVQALYWPHPLVWLLGHAIAEIRERICDDVCVHELGDASSYGETLLAVASGLSHRPGPALGIAMARHTRLVRRLARISRSRGAARCLPRPAERLFVTATAIVVSGVLGALQLTRAEAQAQPADGRGRVFHLQVVAADTGRPVPNADARVWIALRDERRKADAEGRLDITYATGPADRTFSVDAWGDGGAMQRHDWGEDPTRPIPEGGVIRLQPGESLGGLVQDEAGRPIAGAEVYLWSHNYKRKDPHELLFDLRAISGPDGRWRTSGAPETTGELLGFHVVHPDYLSSRDYTAKELIPRITDLRAGKAVTVMKKGVPIEGRVVDENGRPVAGVMVLSSSSPGRLYSEVDRFAVTTDDKGHFRTGQVKDGPWFLLARAPGHAPGVASVKIGKAIPQVEMALGAPHPFLGRVVDPAGKPVEGAFVNIDTWRDYRFLGVYLYSDAEGRFRWDDAPDDELKVNVSCRGYTSVNQQPVRPTPGGVDLTIKPSLAIHGKVRDAETNQSVEHARVEFGAIDARTGDVSSWSGPPRDAASVYRGYLSINFPVEADAYKIRLTANGYAPFVSRAFRRDEKVVVDYDINLVQGRPSGALATVLRPDGKPLAGARVYSTQLNEGLNVQDGVVTSRGVGGRELLTAADGTFPIPAYDKPFLVLILGDDLFAYASEKVLSDSPRIQARPYGKVEGRYFVGTRAISGRPLELSGLLQDESTMHCNLFVNQKATTDTEGRFVFERVIPIPHLRVAHRERSDSAGLTWSLGDPVHVTPGGTTRATIGGKGRPVIGRVEPPEGWTQPVDFTERGGAAIDSNRPFTPYPLELFRDKTTLDGGYWSDWSERWRHTPEGMAYRDSRVAAHIRLAPDGSFRIDDVPAGEYRLTIHTGEDQRGRDRGPFSRINREFTIPPMPGGRSDEPFDLGTMHLKTRTIPRSGEPAPDFEVKTVEGKSLTLKEYRGRYLLLDFGVLWDDQSRLQVARLNDIQKRFGGDRRFAILSLVMSADDAKTRSFIAEKGEPWPQAIIGPLTNPIATAYGIEATNIPLATHAILIGPDGKIIARDLFYNEIGVAIGQALGRPGQ